MMKRILSILAVVMIATITMAHTSLNQGILFEKESATVAESQYARLELVVEYIKKHPDQIIYIGGFTSKDTPEIARPSICEKRATTVKKILETKYKIPASRLVAVGVGVSTKYPETSHNEVVEFFVDDKK